MEKSYNPFKMLGSWVGFVLGMLSIVSPYIANHVLFLHPLAWAGFFGMQMDPEGVGILAVLTLPVVFFIYGWVVHSVLRKIGKENPAAVIILVAMVVVLPTAYGLIKDYQASQALLKSADTNIQAAKALPNGAQRTATDFNRESLGMNSVMAIAKTESNYSILIDKMMSIARDESIAIDVRLTALESLTPRVEAMTSDQKSYLSNQLVLFTDQVGKYTKSSEMDKERLSLRITRLQQLLVQ